MKDISKTFICSYVFCNVSGAYMMIFLLILLARGKHLGAHEISLHVPFCCYRYSTIQPIRIHCGRRCIGGTDLFNGTRLRLLCHHRNRSCYGNRYIIIPDTMCLVIFVACLYPIVKVTIKVIQKSYSSFLYCMTFITR